jgi:hypothetical protein
MLMTRDEAQQILANAKRTVNNRRAYAHHGAVWYPIATLVWVANTGEWPHSTPRHLNNDPLDNRFENLRPPGRAAKPRKKAPATAPAPALTRAPEQPAPQSLFV